MCQDIKSYSDEGSGGFDVHGLICHFLPTIDLTETVANVLRNACKMEEFCDYMGIGLSGKIGVGVCDSLAVFAVGVDEKSVSANEDCENHRHQQRYFPYCPSHKEMRYEMRLQNYKRIPSRPNPPSKRAGQSSRSGLYHESGGLQEGTMRDVMAPCQNELSDTASLCY